MIIIATRIISITAILLAVLGVFEPVLSSPRNNFPPIITNINLPIVIPYGALTSGSLSYNDRNHDATSQSCEPERGSPIGFYCIIEPVFSRFNQTLPIFLKAPAKPEDSPAISFMLRIQIRDKTGNSSTVRIPITITNKSKIVQTVANQLSVQLGGLDIKVDPVAKMVVTQDNLGQSLQLLLRTPEIANILEREAQSNSEIDNLERLLNTLPETDPLNSLAFYLSSLVEISDEIVVNRWSIAGKTFVVPSLHDRSGIIKFDPILHRFVSEKASFSSIVKQAALPLPLIDPPNSVTIRNWLGFTVVYAQLMEDAVAITSKNLIHVDDYQVRAFLIEFHSWLGYQVNADTFVHEPFTKSGTECIRLEGLVGYAFGIGTIKVNLPILEVDFSGIFTSQNSKPLSLFFCADGSKIYE